LILSLHPVTCSLQGVNPKMQSTGQTGGGQTQAFRLWRSMGNDHGIGMESCRAFRIFGRAGSSATSPSVDVQSVPRLIAASNHRNAGILFIKEENRMQKTEYRA
jgi:hypothetical protein